MEPGFRAPKPQMMLGTESFMQVSKCLVELERATRCELVVFSEANGAAVTHTGETDAFDLSGISTLTAANFAATLQMAKMLGEQDAFRFLFLEGEERNIYVCNVGFDFILTIVFGKDVALGMVRIYAGKAVKKLHDVLENARTREEQVVKQIIDSEFNALLGDALDASFGNGA